MDSPNTITLSSNCTDTSLLPFTNVNKSELSVLLNVNPEPVILKWSELLPLVLKVTPLYVKPSVKLSVSMFAVPSKCKSFHWNVELPKSI